MKDYTCIFSKLCKTRVRKGFACCVFLVSFAIPSTSDAQEIPPIPAPPTDPPIPPAVVPPDIAPLPPKPDYVPPDLVPVTDKLETFFNTLAKEGSAKAYPELLKGSGLLDQKAVVADVVANTTAALEAFGNIDGFERVAIRRTGDRLTSLTYIGYTARWPIRWNFVCYYGGGRWQVLDIDISNDLDLMIDRGRDRTPK